MDRGSRSEQTAQLRGHAHALLRHDEGATDADLVDQLRALEEAKATACAAQVAITVRLAASQEAVQREAGIAEQRIGLGIGSQVGLARRESPSKGRSFVSFSRVLTSDLPCTYSARAAGRTTERRARLVVTRTAHCTPEQRRLIDAEIGPLLEGWGDTDVDVEVTKRVHRLDPAGAAERADKARAAGDLRSHGQVMADLMFERLTGLSSADALPITVNLVMSDQTMFNVGDHADEPAHLEGYGPIPADLARRLLLAADAEADVWVRRTDPPRRPRRRRG